MATKLLPKTMWADIARYGTPDNRDQGSPPVNVPGVGNVIFYYANYSDTPTSAALMKPDGSQLKLEPNPDGTVKNLNFTADEVQKASTNDSLVSKYGWMVPLGMAAGVGLLGGAAGSGAAGGAGGLTSAADATAAAANAAGYSVAPGYVSGTGALEAAVGNAAGQSLVPGSLASGTAAASAAPGFMSSLPALQAGLGGLTQAAAPVVESSAPFNTIPTGNAVPAGSGSGLTEAQIAAAKTAAPAVSGGSAMLSRVLSGAGTASDFLSLGLPLAGALAGGMGADQDPAGTTTTVQDLPDWLKPYVTGNLDAAKAYMAANPQDNSLLDPARKELSKTISGDYLNSNPANPFYTGAMDYTNTSMDYLRPTAEGAYLNANPYIDAMYAKARDAVGAGVDSRFSKAGRYGSGAHQGVLGTTFNDLATDIYGNNYATERANMLSAGTTLVGADQAQQAARLAGASGLSGNYNTARGQQLTAATSAPGFTADAATSPFAAFNAFGNLTKGLGVSQTSSPYFTNPTAGALSGALAGYGLSKAFA